jgi:predicted dehydrogenase
MDRKKVWLIGVGDMAVEYAKVLRAIDIDFVAIGRGEKSAAEFHRRTKIVPFTGGIDAYVKTNPIIPDGVIVCVGVGELKNASLRALSYGINTVLVEKPGGMGASEIKELSGAATDRRAAVWIAYNRRFYASVARAKEIAREDGGITSFTFDFTEWSHIIVDLRKAQGVKERWFLANSTHVVDLAFYLAGRPKRIDCYCSGGVPWHPSASIFAGAGTTEHGALFSYQANWEAPGRWGVELLTKRHKLILRPLETLQMQEIGSVTVDDVKVEDSLDIMYKPGLYNQVLAFLGLKEGEGLCSVQEHALNLVTYYKMARY